MFQLEQPLFYPLPTTTLPRTSRAMASKVRTMRRCGMRTRVVRVRPRSSAEHSRVPTRARHPQSALIDVENDSMETIGRLIAGMKLENGRAMVRERLLRRVSCLHIF
jgi:hypothetical protein